MIDVLKFMGGLLGALAFGYLFGAAAAWDADPGKWVTEGRVIVAIVSFGLGGIIGAGLAARKPRR